MRFVFAIAAMLFGLAGTPATAAGWQDYAGHTLIVSMQGQSDTSGILPISQNVSMNLHFYFSTEGKLFYSPSKYKYGKTGLPYDGKWGVVFDLKSGNGTITIDKLFGKHSARVKATNKGLAIDVAYGVSGKYGDATFKQKVQLTFSGSGCAATSVVEFDAKVTTSLVSGTSRTKERTQSVKCALAKGKK